jgi:hypothetical protein
MQHKGINKTNMITKAKQSFPAHLEDIQFFHWLLCSHDGGDRVHSASICHKSDNECGQSQQIQIHQIDGSYSGGFIALAKFTSNGQSSYIRYLPMFNAGHLDWTGNSLADCFTLLS